MKARVRSRVAGGIVAVCVAAMVLACGKGTEESDPDPDPDPSSSLPPSGAPTGAEDEVPLLFAPSIEAAMAGEFAAEYPILDQRDIIAVVPVPIRSGIEFVELRLYLPNGTLHSTIWRAFTADSDPPDSVDHPTLVGQVPVERVTEVDGGGRVYLSIPVAGTDITRYRLSGAYTAEARLALSDGVPDATGGFVITLPAAMLKRMGR